jgi:type III secretion protein S
MQYEMIIRLTSEAMLMCLMISLPVVVVAASVGLMVSFVQAITSLQDQSISQGAKLIAVIITLIIAAPWGASAVLRFAETVFQTALGSP